MYEQIDKPKENKSRAVANSVAQKKSNAKQDFSYIDNRSGAEQKLKTQLKNWGNNKISQNVKTRPETFKPVNPHLVGTVQRQEMIQMVRWGKLVKHVGSALAGLGVSVFSAVAFYKEPKATKGGANGVTEVTAFVGGLTLAYNQLKAAYADLELQSTADQLAAARLEVERLTNVLRDEIEAQRQRILNQEGVLNVGEGHQLMAIEENVHQVAIAINEPVGGNNAEV